MLNSAPTFTSVFSEAANSSNCAGEEAEFLRDHHVREYLHPNIIQVDLVVVEFPAIGDRLFQSGDPALQLLEGLVGLQLRVAFGHCEQPADPGAQLLLGRADGGDIAGCARRAHRGPGAHHLLERFLFELHVPLAGFHQFRQLVVTLLQQHVDVRPGNFDVFPQAYQSVVDADEIDA